MKSTRIFTVQKKKFPLLLFYSTSNLSVVYLSRAEKKKKWNIKKRKEPKLKGPSLISYKQHKGRKQNPRVVGKQKYKNPQVTARPFPDLYE